MLPGQLCGFVLIVVVVVEAVVVGVIVAAVGAVVVAFVVVDVGVAVAVVEEPPSVVLAWGHQAPAWSIHCCSASSSPRKVQTQVGGGFHFSSPPPCAAHNAHLSVLIAHRETEEGTWAAFNSNNQS